MKVLSMFSWLLTLVSVAFTLNACPADVQLDVLFVLDSCGSTGSESYNKLLEFIGQVSSLLPIGEKSTRVGIYTSDTNPCTNFRLTGNAQSFFQTLRGIRYQHNSLDLVPSLYTSSRLFLLSPRRKERCPGVVVLITDSSSPEPELTLNIAQFLKDKDIKIVTVGVTDRVKDPELHGIASKHEYSFYVSDFDSLSDSAGLVAEAICQDSQ